MPEILNEQLEKYDSIVKKIQEKYPLCEIKGVKVDYSQESRHKKVKTLRKKGLHLWWN